jgi:hypothetical protein
MVINEVEGNKEDLIQDFVWLLPVFVLEYMDNGGRDVKLRF